jgi:signal transduction histidine kinase/ligand-binding sensor domain-containing protein
MARHLWWYWIAVSSTVCLVAGIVIAPVHGSQPSPYVATNWQTEQGLPQNSIYDIAQDHDGYLWLATAAGVVRFDGVRFRVFGAAEIPTLRTGWILSLHSGRSGELWMGTLNSGLVRLQNGSATTYTQSEGLPASLVNSIREDSNGGLWFNTARGIARFEGGRFERYPAHQSKEVAEFFLQARDGSMWFRAGNDVVRFGPDGSIATRAGGSIVREARDGSVWIGYQDRLVRYHQGVFSDVPLPPATPRQWTGRTPEQGVLAVATDTDGELVLLTGAGFVRTAGPKLTAPEPVRLPVNTPDLPKVFSLLVDREGNRWVGTLSTGLFRLRRALVTSYTKDEGLSDLPFRTVFQDRDGRIWLGGDLLYRFDGNQFHQIPGMADIRAITQTNDGDVWFGGSGGLYRWRSGALTRYQVDGPAVTSIHQDQQGTLWVLVQSYRQGGGLYRFHDGQFERVSPAAGFHLAGDRDGAVWLSTFDGIQYRRGGKIVLYDETHGLRRSATVYLCQDASGTMWASTAGGGLYRFRNNQFTAITTKDGLHSDDPGAILDDGNGSLWFGCNRGIFRLSLRDLNDVADRKISSLSPVEYGVAEGMRASESNGENPAAWRARDGRLWFSTVRGVVVVDPTAGNPVPPPVVLEEASANELVIDRGGQTALPPGNHTFDFRFTALSLSAPEKQRFKYRLQPYDRDWVDAGAGRTAHYTNMAPGEYSFHVIASNSFGVWNNQGATMRFVLRPHFYQTKAFYALGVLFILTGVWIAYQLRMRKLQHEFNVRLEERLDERTRIARELHDTLLQSFQGLLYQFQAARNLFSRRPEKALETLDSAIASADNAIAEGRDAIQNLRGGATERRLEDLLNSTGRDLRDVQTGSDQVTAFQVTTEGQPRTLSPLLQDEIYRIAREVLRNAFRHAQAGRIEAAIHYDAAVFRLRIRDDGKGIDPNVLQQGSRAGHFGLPGIRERAKRIGANLKLWSEIAAGTEVELTIPARVAYESGRHRKRLRLFGKVKVDRDG